MRSGTRQEAGVCAWAATGIAASTRPTISAASLCRKIEANVRRRGALRQPPADIGGYYLPDVSKLDAVMRPSPTLNAVLAAV